MADRLQKMERRQFWQSHLDAWALTGLSQAEYCRQNNLKTHRFTYWKRKYKQIWVGPSKQPIYIGKKQI